MLSFIEKYIKLLKVMYKKKFKIRGENIISYRKTIFIFDLDVP